MEIPNEAIVLIRIIYLRRGFWINQVSLYFLEFRIFLNATCEAFSEMKGQGEKSVVPSAKY